jgi:hypothetical protein
MRTLPLIFVGLTIGFALAFTAAASVRMAPLCTSYECPVGLP